MRSAILAASIALALPAQAQLFIPPPPRDYSIPSVTLTFENLSIEHSKSWLDLWGCGDYPEVMADPANYNMTWSGSLTFTPPNKGWFTETVFTLTSDRTLAGTYTAYVSGFYGPGVEGFGIIGSYPNGYATLGVMYQPYSYKNQEIRLPFAMPLAIAAPVPEPETWAMLLLGLIGAVARKVKRLFVTKEFDAQMERSDEQ